MIPLFSRSSILLSWFAACFLAVSVATPTTIHAQPASTKRAAQPAALHGPAKAAYRGFNPWVPNPAVTGKEADLVIDAVTGRELLSDRADELRHPASLTKLMTLYLTFAALDSGRMSLGDALPVSASAHNAQPTKMGVPLGGSVTVRDAVMGLVTRSANDAAIVLAEAQGGGDEETFARAMTQKARQLGMTSTVYRNASGLPNREQVTTARDLARLASALLRDFPHYYALFSVQSYLYRGRPLENHNRMLLTYPGADGFKTGYTSASGFNLVMSATRDGRRLIGVVMGGDTAYQRDRQMADLMDRSFASAQSMNLPTWTLSRSPSTPRYTASQFAPGAALPEAPRTIVASKGPGAPAVQAPPAVTMASLTGFGHPPVTAPGNPAAAGAESWGIQIGAFGDSRAAQQALERASAALPADLRAHSASSVDEVQTAQRTFHRARLINLTQDEAVDGCRRLAQRKIYCSTMQITASSAAGGR